jgi:hypothetical protein
MPKIFHKRSGSWTEVKSVFQKRNGAWTEVLNVFRKTGGSWVKVFAAVKIPGNTVPPTITGSGYLFGTLTNTNLGTWTNTPTSYARQWRRGNPSSGGGEPTSYSNISGETSSTYVTTSSDNGKYVVCQVTATNAVGNNVAVSNSIYISKYAPVSLLPYTFSGTPIVGATLTALEQIGSWKNTTTNTDDTYPDTFEYEWSYTDGTIIQSSTLSAGSYPRNINSSSFLIDSVDLNKQIRVRVTGTNTGGSATSGYTTSGTVTTTYSFSFGNTLYVGSNGYIGLDNGGSVAGTAGNGRNVNIWNEDLVQYKLQEYSDSSNYHLYFRAYRYQSPLVRSAINALDYQIKFYTGQPYCDVYLVRKGSSVPTYIDNPGYYSNGLNGGTGIVGPFAWTAGSVLRVYFNGTLASTSAASWTSISDTLWKDITNADIDDSFTTVVTSANQSAPIPTNTVAPTLSTDTGNFSAGSTITINAGTWTNTNSYAYELLYGTSTPISDTSTSTKTLFNTNQYVITNADATASSYYFRGRVTGYADSGQTGASTIALSATSSRSYINSTTTISVGTATSSGFTISGTASPPVYTSISSIQIFNSSQTLISTITTGLPSVNSSTGAWSYIWTGGSSSTTYYAKVTVIASDSAVTTFTTAFSSSITTSAGVSTPTALSATNNSGAIRLTFSGGSGDQYDVYYGNSSTRPTDGQAFADYPNVTSPYDPPLTSRDITRWFWVRKSTGSTRSNWYPSDSSVSIRLPLFAPATPVITNSAQSSTSLSWHWTQPTPSASQDEPTSWDYNISTSTATPSSWTNITTRPTSGSPLVTGSLTASTTYYLHVRAKNADNSTTTYQSGTTTAASVSPGAPTGLSVSRTVGSDFISTSLSPSGSGNTSKTQTWSFGRNTTFTIAFTRGSNATSSELYYSTSNTTPSSSTAANGASSTSASGNLSYTASASTTNNNDYAVYFWVRSKTATENSAWTYAGTQNVDTPNYSSFSIVLYRTSVGNANFVTATPSRNDLSYTWTGVSTSFSHQAQVRLTFDGTARTANS